MSERLSAEAVVAALKLERHPEGGWYVETFREAADDGARAASTAIYFLLARGEVSAWHRVDAAEHWLWHAGAALDLTIAGDGAETATVALGADLAAGERPQATVPARAWQSARSRGDWTLVSCVVAPGFEFAGFELAPEGWSPGDPTDV